MRFFTVLYFIPALAVTSYAQNIIQPVWTSMENTTGSGNLHLPYLVQDTAHHIFICTDAYQPGPGLGFYVSKHDQNGNFLWKQIHQAPGSDLIYSAATDNEGSIYVGGNSYSLVLGTSQHIVIKYDADGEKQWSYAYQDTTAVGKFLSKLIVLPDQDLLVVGSFVDVPASNSGMLVTRLRPDGSIVWTATYDAGTNNYTTRDAIVKDGRLIVWGHWGNAEGTGFFCWQLDLEGNTLEGHATEAYSDDFQHHFTTGADGNLYVGDYYGEYKITKFKCNGETAWQYNKPVIIPPSPNQSYARLSCIQTDSLGSVFGAGSIFTDSLGWLELTTRLDSNGSLIWEHTIMLENAGPAGPLKGITLDDGRFMITGAVTTNPDSNHYQYFLALYNADGFEWAGMTFLPGPRYWADALCQDGNSIYVAGVSQPDPPEEKQHFISKYFLSDLVSGAGAPFLSVQPRPVYPNPFQDVLSMDLEQPSGPFRLTITDHTGKTVRTQQGTLSGGSIRVEQLGHLPAGVYTVHVVAGGAVFVGRAVKV